MSDFSDNEQEKYNIFFDGNINTREGMLDGFVRLLGKNLQSAEKEILRSEINNALNYYSVSYFEFTKAKKEDDYIGFSDLYSYLKNSDKINNGTKESILSNINKL